MSSIIKGVKKGVKKVFKGVKKVFKAITKSTIGKVLLATYTGVIGDAGKLITLSNASAITFTIPANASVAYPVGTVINLVQLGAGQVTVAITSDTLNSPDSRTKLKGQYSLASVIKITSTSWVLSGDIVA